MAKVLMGLAAAVVIAVGGFFGFEFYTQHRIVGEVEAAFAQMRAGGGKASHGKVSFDLKSRTLRIDEIATESATQPPVHVKIASVTASGVGQPDAARFSADTIEASDIEIGGSLAGPTDGKLAYKMPRVVVKDYSGPASVHPPSASKSIIDAYRSGLEQLATVSAASVSAPSIAGTINFGPAMSGEFTYSGVALQGIKDGKIATTQVERAGFTVNTQHAGKSDKMTGEIANLASRDFDSAALAAILDPQKANDDRYISVYGKTTAGPYTVTSAQGLRMRIDAMTVDDVGVRPSKLQLPALLATIQAAGTAHPSPTQTRELIERAANIYEGMRVGTAEMRGLSAETPQGPFKLQTIRFNLEDGKIGEFAFEGLDTNTPKGPLKLGRFALKSLDIANFMRTSAQFANPAQPPSPELIAGVFPLIGGVEIKGVTAPFKNTGKLVNVDTFSLDWGQFVGPIPSKVRLKLKMSAPLDSSDPRQQMLLGAGLDTAAIDLDVGAAWTEASKSFALEPVSLEFGGLLQASARVSLSSVPRGLFSPDLARATAMAAEIEAGTLEFTMHDSGFLDLANTLNARVLNVSREEARRSFVDKIRDSGRHVAATKPDAAAAAETLARFIETSGQTLIIKLAPVGKVSALRFIELFKADPDNADALAQFRIEASTGL